MNTLMERMRLALAGVARGTQAGLARACGIKTPSVTAWFNGRTKSIKGDNLVRAAAYFNVRPEWLAYGKGPMREEIGEPKAFLRPITVWEDPADLPPGQFVFFPKLEHRWSCGNGGPDHDMVEATDKSISFTAEWVQEEGWNPRTHYTMRATGESMEPTIQDKAPVVIDTSEAGKAVRSGKIYAIRINGEPLLKRLDRLPGGRLRVRSDNPAPDYAPFEVAEGEIDIVGRAVWTPMRL